MNSLVDSISNTRYKGKQCLQLIHTYLDDPTDEGRDQVFHALLPIINVVMRQQYRYLDDIDRDDLAQVGAIDFWGRTAPDKLPRFESARSIFHYFYKSALHAAHKARRKQTTRVFEFAEHGLLPPIGSYNFSSPEQQAFIRELPRITYEAAEKIFLKKCRFEGDERELVLYFIDCIAHSKRVSSLTVRNLVKKSEQVQFFYDLAEVLLRRGLLDLKSDGNLSSLLSDDSHALDWDFYELSSSDHNQGASTSEPSVY